jgi:hypothetical protein
MFLKSAQVIAFFILSPGLLLCRQVLHPFMLNGFFGFVVCFMGSFAFLHFNVADNLFHLAVATIALYLGFTLRVTRYA